MLVVFASTMGAAEVAVFTIVQTLWGMSVEFICTYHIVPLL